MTLLTQEDIKGLKLLPSYQLRASSDGYRWECQGRISASFPTSAEALKSLANIAKQRIHHYRKESNEII